MENEQVIPETNEDSEVMESQTAIEQNAFIAEMGEEAQAAGEFDPTAAVDSSQPEPEPEQVSEEQLLINSMLARAGLDSAETMMQTFLNPDLVLGEEQKDKVAERAAPVMAKYGTEPPAWLVEYKDELLLLGALFTMGAGVHLQNNALKAQKLEKLKAERAANNDNLGVNHAAN